jgi:hypothetical protein
MLSSRFTAQVRAFDEETRLAFTEALLYMQSQAECELWLKERR